MHLARMEASAVVNAVLDRMPRVRRDETAPAPVITGVAFRSPAAVPLVWD
jgi:cytochrome P450